MQLSELLDKQNTFLDMSLTKSINDKGKYSSP